MKTEELLFLASCCTIASGRIVEDIDKADETSALINRAASLALQELGSPLVARRLGRDGLKGGYES